MHLLFGCTRSIRNSKSWRMAKKSVTSSQENITNPCRTRKRGRSGSDPNSTASAAALSMMRNHFALSMSLILLVSAGLMTSTPSKHTPVHHQLHHAQDDYKHAQAGPDAPNLQSGI